MVDLCKASEESGWPFDDVAGKYFDAHAASAAEMWSRSSWGYILVRFTSVQKGVQAHSYTCYIIEHNPGHRDMLIRQDIGIHRHTHKHMQRYIQMQHTCMARKRRCNRSAVAANWLGGAAATERMRLKARI